MSTLREQAQFIDELRQHYRRLDGLLVRFRDRVSTDELWDINLCVLALRRLLFGGIGDPNFPGSSAQTTSFANGSVGPSRPNSATAESGAIRPRTRAATKKPAPATDQFLRLVEDAPTAPMSVHDPAEDLEVIP